MKIGGKKDKKLTIKVSSDEWDILNFMAESKNETLSEYCRDLLFLKNARFQLEYLSRAKQTDVKYYTKKLEEINKSIDFDFEVRKLIISLIDKSNQKESFDVRSEIVPNND